MAPRAPDPPERLFARMRDGAAAGLTQMAFIAKGHSHDSHVACKEDGVWRVRHWVCDPLKGQAFMKEHGHFMPEDAEAISEPGDTVVLEAPTLDALFEKLRAHALV